MSGRDRAFRVFIAVVGLAVAAGGVAFAIIAMQRTSGWTETTGNVVDVHRTNGDDPDWDTTISFQDSDGIEYTFRSEHGNSGSRAGDPVTLKYPPRDPDRAQTTSDTREDRDAGLIIGALGLAAAVWAIWAIVEQSAGDKTKTMAGDKHVA